MSSMAQAAPLKNTLLKHPCRAKPEDISIAAMDDALTIRPATKSQALAHLPFESSYLLSEMADAT
jgi:hypothetical protein